MSFNHNPNQVILEKQTRFFILKPFKRQIDPKTHYDSTTSNIPEMRKFHQIIRDILKDFQYFTNYQKQQKNYTQGLKVLKMNGMKIIRQNDTYFIQKYPIKEQNIITRTTQLNIDKTKMIFFKTQCLTDPSYFIELLGYINKQKIQQYVPYYNLQVYKCPAYGKIIIYPYNLSTDCQYIQISYVNSIENIKNQVGELIIEKLGMFMIEQNEIDPYTLKPKTLKSYVFTDNLL